MDIASQPAFPETKGAGQLATVTAGTSVKLPDQVASQVTIKAKVGNTGFIYVKPNGTTGENYSTNGFILSAGDTVTVELQKNLNEIAIDSSVNAEGISYIFIQCEGR